MGVGVCERFAGYERIGLGMGDRRILRPDHQPRQDAGRTPAPGQPSRARLDAEGSKIVGEESGCARLMAVALRHALIVRPQPGFRDTRIWPTFRRSVGCETGAEAVRPVAMPATRRGAPRRGIASKTSRLFHALVVLAAVGLLPGGWSKAAAAASALAPHAPGERTAETSRRLGIGREASPEEIAGWDIDIRPDGQGLPPGKGAVKDGEGLYTQRCAGCHGDFGEGLGRWPALSGRAGTLADDRPVKTIGSYWPYASTLIDYVRRAQPFGDAQSLSNDEVYAVAAYLLFLNDIVDEDFVLTKDTFRKISMPNERGFHDDDRETTERAFWNPNPCMTNCKTDLKIIDRARILDVTPAAKSRRQAID